jgi:hypothetical protein
VRRHGIFFGLTPFAERFQHGSNVFDRNLLLHQPAQNFGELLQGDQSRDFFDQIGERLFDEFQNSAHLLDADEFACVLPVELGQVQDHHFQARPVTDVGFLQNRLVFFFDPQARHPHRSGEQREGEVVAAERFVGFVGQNVFEDDFSS